MNSPKKVFIALGSNIGDRMGYLQQALNMLHLKLGWIEEISSVYETPAWGFAGNSFLNACVGITTRYSPTETLAIILNIETELGRQRHDKEAYENRTLDLDILLYGQEVVDSHTLQIPHPEMSKRNFVLKPLNDIAQKELHPVYKKTISNLLRESEDSSRVSKYENQLKKPQREYRFADYNYVAIEGNIGAGKTSFSTMVSQDFNAKLILERFKDNPFLPKFYEDKERYAFSLEMSFLADRYQQLSDDLAQYDIFRDFVISDYDVFKSLIFAKITLQEDEFLLYKKLFHLMYKELVKPGLYIYLYQNTDRLLENIKKRGREYEQNIEAEYLMKINQSYLSFLKSQVNMKVEIIDISEIDFITNREDYLTLLDKIEERL